MKNLQGHVYIDISGEVGRPQKSPTFAGTEAFEESKSPMKTKGRKTKKNKGKKDFDKAFEIASAEKSRKGQAFGKKNPSVSVKAKGSGYKPVLKRKAKRLAKEKSVDRTSQTDLQCRDEIFLEYDRIRGQAHASGFKPK